MRNKLAQWLSIQRTKNPSRMVLITILVFNILFFFAAALAISSLSLDGTEKMGFFEAVFCTITMVLDAGCIQFVIADIGTSGVAVAILCLCIIFVGMVSFTGAVIGYISNYISSYIESTNAGNKKLLISGHMVILNWNTRGSEIINDLLYCGGRQKVVVLVGSRKAEIEKEIHERLSDTLSRENGALAEKLSKLPYITGRLRFAKGKYRNNVTVIVREGDVFSSKQLHDISLERARTTIILGNDVNNSLCRLEQKERREETSRGNELTVKTLMQVADITAADYSDDNQKIIVEITDEWTWELVAKIIKYKKVDGKCNIVPVRINQVLGQILSQFSHMPELNMAYRELFSNKGVTFYSIEREAEDPEEYIAHYLSTHKHAIPLTFMKSKGHSYCCFAANSEKEIRAASEVAQSDYSVKLNRDYWVEQKNVIILGHNSKSAEIMSGFNSYRNEWHYKFSDEEIIKITVIDERKNLEKMAFYKQYPFVLETVAASVYEKDIICDTIDRVVSENDNDTCVLILSDDEAPNESLDAGALANLVYINDIIKAKKEADPDFDDNRIDVVVEIIDPKHHDIVNNYSANNVVISNRYISKMITQIGQKEALYDFYRDILTYDGFDSAGFYSREIYIKKVSGFFSELPGPCTAEELIRAVYAASVDKDIPEEERYPTMLLGYVRAGGEMILFGGNQAEIKVELANSDKIIVYSTH